MSITEKRLTSARLRLQPVSEADVADIQLAAAEREIADSMISLPHPYPAGEARRYVSRELAERKSGRAIAFTIRDKVEATFLGIIEVRAIEQEHSQAELSFWLARPAQGKGIMQEALPSIVAFGFNELRMNRLYAYHMLRNPASGRILEKSGFIQEGLLRQRVRKWGIYEDVALWAMLRMNWRP